MGVRNLDSSYIEIDNFCYPKDWREFEAEYSNLLSLAEAQVATQQGEERHATQSEWLGFQATIDALKMWKLHEMPCG